MNIFGIRIAKERFRFSAAHLTLFADGRAEKLHGHNYQVRVELTGERTEQGLLVDPSPLKEALGALCANLDEKTLFAIQSPAVRIEPADGGSSRITVFGKTYCLPNEDLVLLDLPNVTMEALAHYFCFELIDRLSLKKQRPGLHSLRVEIEENVGQAAWYRHHL